MAVCEICNQSFKLQRTYLQHKRSQHQEQSKVICFECGKQFSMSTMRLHKSSAHRGVTFKCEQCDTTFTETSSLIAHVKSVHEGVNHPFNLCN